MTAPTMPAPAGSGGVWIRIKHRFGPRLSEWFVAALMLLWGAVLLWPANTFNGASWVIFRSIMGEEEWGLCLVLLSLLRLGGLIVNGAREDVTPWIRGVSAAAGFVIFLGFTMGFGFSGVIGTNLATSFALAFLELFNVYRAFHDLGVTDAAPR